MYNFYIYIHNIIKLIVCIYILYRNTWTNVCMCVCIYVYI